MNCSKQTDNDGLNISGGNDEEAWSYVGVETWKNEVYIMSWKWLSFLHKPKGYMFKKNLQNTLDFIIEKIVARCREYLELDPALLGEPASYHNDGL